MAESRVSPTLIGGFVAGASALAVVSLLLFGSGTFFEDRTHMVAYFSSSVRGLDAGAPIIFRGVNVGQVTRIAAVVDSRTLEVAVPVFFDLMPDRVDVQGPRQAGDAGLHAMIGAGLRAQLKSESLITGKLYVDLDLHPNTPVVYHDIETDAIEMPTIPTAFEEFQRQARAVLQRVSEMPLEDLVTRLASAADGLDRLLNDPRLSHAIGQLDDTLAELHGAVASVDALVEPGSPLQYQLMTTLQELEAAARSFRLLADNLSREPEQLIFGKPGGEGTR